MNFDKEKTAGDMLANAIGAIEALTRQSVHPEQIEHKGKKYLVSCTSDGTPTYATLPEDPSHYPECMKVNTLDALVNYIHHGIVAGEITDKVYINVTSPTRVEVATPVNEFGKRKYIALAERYRFDAFSFATQHDYEGFIINLRSKFSPNEDMVCLLDCLKNMTSSNELRAEDNGVSQTVVAKQGVTLGSIAVQPIWKLRPFRTFTEIEQPESLFLLRLSQRGGGDTTYALHETDGGAWAITAMDSIRSYLCDKLSKEIENAAVFVL